MYSATMRQSSEQSEVSLRPLNRQDFPLLVEWINTPHVAMWWDGVADMHSVTSKYEPRIQPNSATSVYAIQVGELAVGMIQCYRHADFPDWDRIVGVDKAAGIDYLVGDIAHTGKGVGSTAI